MAKEKYDLTMCIEFVACYRITSQVILLKYYIFEQLVDFISKQIIIYYDDSVTILFTKNNKNTNRLRHKI